MINLIEILHEKEYRISNIFNQKRKKRYLSNIRMKTKYSRFLSNIMLADDVSEQVTIERSVLR